MQERKFRQPLFLTYKQATDLGGHVRKGERGFTVVFWKQIMKTKEDETESTQKRLFPFLHTVFNIAQIDGVEIKPIDQPVFTHTPIETCELILANMPSKPNIAHGGNRAYYAPSIDHVQLPLQEQFLSPENYYQTAFHELIHSTGHKSRLNRFKVGETPARFGDEQYSKEELIAEIGATVLSARAGITDTIINSSAAYIQGWLKALKKDVTLIFSAANQADKAVCFICNETSVEISPELLPTNLSTN
jgi:antirestriction protein ArdC